jgi:hypothetical protein
MAAGRVSVSNDKLGTHQSALAYVFASWLHVADERNPPPWGRIPLPEDIFGSVLLSKGIIQPNTYQRMPSHRFVTSNGLFQLSSPLQSILRSTLLEEVKQSKK